MKGIILSGGKGSRLGDMTKVVSKQLLPVYDKPMIYYPLSVLIKHNIKDILIITNPEYEHSYERLLDCIGASQGIKIYIISQPSPKGLPDAYCLAEDFLDGDASVLILGDNLFFGQAITEAFYHADNLLGAVDAIALAYQVANPSAYGVVTLGNHFGHMDLYEMAYIEEKPVNPKSAYSIPGLYFCTGKAVEVAKELTPSERGELEITDLLQRLEAKIYLLPEETVWFDAGTPDRLLEASEYVAAYQHRTGKSLGFVCK
jgi:glucose-1-phosphate thymidylyltransferase